MATNTKFTFIPENNNCKCNLQEKQTYELLELLQRQQLLLKNRSIIAKLKDKGVKIEKFRDEISNELATRSELKTLDKITSELQSESEWKTDSVKIYKITESHRGNPLEILAQNGQIPHIKRLIDKETDTGFSFKPYQTSVDDKIKNIKSPNIADIVQHHQHSTSEHTTKKIHLDESLSLLTEQLSALKVFSSRRANDNIKDILNESININEDQDNNELVDDFESTPGSSVNINITE